MEFCFACFAEFTLTRVVAGPNRTIFLNFLEQRDLAMILHLLTVGAHEGKSKPKEKFQLLHGQKSTFSFTSSLKRHSNFVEMLPSFLNVTKIALLIHQT